MRNEEVNPLGEIFLRKEGHKNLSRCILTKMV